MNILQIKQIAIVDFLLAIGIHPTKETTVSAWYHAPYREDENPSFKVNKNRNIWYDFATAKSGDIIDLAVLVYRTPNIPKVLKMIERAAPAVPLKVRTFVPHPQPSAPAGMQPQASAFQDLRLLALASIPLLSYLSKRGIDLDIARQECREAHYTCHGKSYYAIAFPNEAGGYEIRNPYYKGCIAPKAVSLFSEGQTDSVCLFEGFMDYLSFLTLRKRERLSVPCYGADLLVLNSVNNLPKALPRLKAYKHIYCYLDNDDAGRRVVDMLRELKSDAVHDMMETYPLYKDLNDILTGKKKMP
ncbi:toprim domain-containing protein [Bacteroides sp. An19]|uniref:toprim domain-containing protein n=1 Tax=Bacteroides sp. An19 TaxID=1965580 RepID=UPI000B37703F|nr:toprim domain-containing protein [Bacteroides sp. An19]OUP29898.1 DNA primase [Bacteroides sp. An19]